MALRQCGEVLGRHTIVLVAPSNLRLQCYKNALRKNGAKDVREVFFRDRFFRDINGYNALMLSYRFYHALRSFQYILVFQLDAWVFRDELHHWCDMGYDYIGAPWLSKNSASIEDAFRGVGNGGFSLRNVSAFRKVLRSFRYIRSFSECVDFHRRRQSSRMTTMLSILRNKTVANNTFCLLNNFGANEDKFWGIHVPNKFSWFRVPGLDVALRFSFESRCRESYKWNGDQLPFGCHGWYGEEWSFWKDHIDLGDDSSVQ